MEKAYICSPLSGDIKQNISNAIAYSKFVFKRCGMIPVMSHFYALILDDTKEAERKIGTALGIDMVLDASHLWVFGDELTSGMKEEIKTAQSLKRTIHYVNDYQCKEILKQFGGLQNEETQLSQIAL